MWNCTPVDLWSSSCTHFRVFVNTFSYMKSSVSKRVIMTSFLIYLWRIPASSVESFGLYESVWLTTCCIYQYIILEGKEGKRLTSSQFLLEMSLQFLYGGPEVHKHNHKWQNSTTIRHKRDKRFLLSRVVICWCVLYLRATVVSSKGSHLGLHFASGPRRQLINHFSTFTKPANQLQHFFAVFSSAAVLLWSSGNVLWSKKPDPDFPSATESLDNDWYFLSL